MDVQTEVPADARGPEVSANQPVLRTEKLTKHFGQVVGLEGLDLEVWAGEVLGYLGPNGAGKTNMGF